MDFVFALVGALVVSLICLGLFSAYVRNHDRKVLSDLASDSRSGVTGSR